MYRESVILYTDNFARLLSTGAKTMNELQLTLEQYKVDENISHCFSEKKEIILHLGDTHNFLKTIPSGKINLIITSPPYNIGKQYESKISIEKYLKHQELLIDELIRILHPNGSICWQVGNYIDKGEVFPLDIYFYTILRQKDLN